MATATQFDVKHRSRALIEGPELESVKKDLASIIELFARGEGASFP